MKLNKKFSWILLIQLLLLSLTFKGYKSLQFNNEANNQNQTVVMIDTSTENNQQSIQETGDYLINYINNTNKPLKFSEDIKINISQYSNIEEILRITILTGINF